MVWNLAGTASARSRRRWRRALDSAAAETLLTAAFLAYAKDVSTGRVRANQVDKDIDIQQRKVAPADLLKAAATVADFPAYLAALPPKGDYPALQKALAAWRDKRAKATFTALPDGGALKPGMTDPRVPLLRKRLAELDLVVPDLAAGAAADLYDEPLAAIVKSYQETKGLTVDGVIGAKTTQSLNTTIDERIEQIVANLERRRWLPEDLGKRYVLVNAGDYSMVFVDDGKPVFQSLVIVGTPKDPTPEIQSVMRGFQTNPYWTVPQSIAGEEYLPMLRRNPNALAAAGFKIFENWNDDTELDPATVDWSDDQPQGLPLPHPPGAGRQQRAGLHLLPVCQPLRDLHARHGQPLAVYRRQPQFQPRLHPAAEPARLRREGVRRPRRLQQGPRAPGHQRRRAGPLHLSRAGNPLRHLPHGHGRRRRRRDLPRRHLRPRPAGRARHEQAPKLGSLAARLSELLSPLGERLGEGVMQEKAFDPLT